MPGSKIILASKSPRRYELIKKLIAAEKITIIGSDIDESIISGEDGASYTKRIAIEKVNNVVNYLKSRTDADYILGADTIIQFEKEIIGKPSDNNEAYEILIQLRDNWHEVITGVCLMKFSNGNRKTFSVCSQVLMRNYTKTEIEKYIKTGEPMGKAGAYAIQGRGKDLIREYK